MKIKYYGCILPSGNTDQFPFMERKLKKLNVEGVQLFKMTLGGQVFLIPENQLDKLPQDSEHPELPWYIPTKDEGGHGVYPLRKTHVSKTFNGKWTKCRD